MLKKLWQDWKRRDAAFGPQVSSYDLIKAIAVVIMVIDHLGYFFFPQQEWWRAIGRTGFPVWFFLAGYSRQGGVQWTLVPGMLLLVAAKAAANMAILPVNALLTIFLIRLMIINKPTETTFILAVTVSALAIIAFPFSSSLFEYGTIGLLFGYLGYTVKNSPDSLARRLLALCAYAAFIYTMQADMFHFNLFPYLVMTLGTAAFCYWLYVFRLVIFTGSKSWFGLSPLIRVLGRHTLLIYVVHLTLFSFVKAYVIP